MDPSILSSSSCRASNASYAARRRRLRCSCSTAVLSGRRTPSSSGHTSGRMSGATPSLAARRSTLANLSSATRPSRSIAPRHSRSLRGRRLRPGDAAANAPRPSRRWRHSPAASAAAPSPSAATPNPRPAAATTAVAAARFARRDRASSPPMRGRVCDVEPSSKKRNVFAFDSLRALSRPFHQFYHV